jgi:hypothetical protein
MSTYLFTFRPPSRYAPSADTFDAWAAWQVELGARLKEIAAVEVTMRIPAIPVPIRTPGRPRPADRPCRRVFGTRGA